MPCCPMCEWLLGKRRREKKNEKMNEHHQVIIIDEMIILKRVERLAKERDTQK